VKICNANIFTENREFIDGGVDFDTAFTAVGDSGDGLDVDGAYLIPGLIDIHSHGIGGDDASDGDTDELVRMSKCYAEYGVTSVCFTTMTVGESALYRAMKAVRAFNRPKNGAQCVGINLEGPFLCYAKRGAQAPENLQKPNIDLFKRLDEASGGQIRLVTVAPEEDEGYRFIREASKLCTVALGHTTADYMTAMRAYEAGASHTTHLFNGMPAFLHRSPGVVGAAFDSGATVELICDGLHIHPSVIRAVYRLFDDKLVMISDSLRCAGMPDGEYELGGQPITMKDGKATLRGTDTLAGSSISVLDALRNAVQFGIPLEAAVYAATAAPAKVIGREGNLGVIKKGAAADFLLLDRDLNLKAVYIAGKRIG